MKPIAGDDLDNLFSSIGTKPARQRTKKRSRRAPSPTKSRMTDTSSKVDVPPHPFYTRSNRLRHPAVANRDSMPPPLTVPHVLPKQIPESSMPLASPFSNMKAAGTVTSLPLGCVPLFDTFSMQSQGTFNFLTQSTLPSSTTAVTPLNVPPIPIQFSPLPLQNHSFNFSSTNSSSSSSSYLPPPPVPYVASMLNTATYLGNSSVQKSFHSKTHAPTTIASSCVTSPSTVHTTATSGTNNSLLSSTGGMLSGLTVLDTAKTAISAPLRSPPMHNSQPTNDNSTNTNSCRDDSHIIAPEVTMVEHFEQLKRSKLSKSQSDDVSGSDIRASSSRREIVSMEAQSHRDRKCRGTTAGRKHKWTRSEDAELYKMVRSALASDHIIATLLDGSFSRSCIDL